MDLFFFMKPSLFAIILQIICCHINFWGVKTYGSIPISLKLCFGWFENLQSYKMFVNFLWKWVLAFSKFVFPSYKLIKPENDIIRCREASIDVFDRFRNPQKTTFFIVWHFGWPGSMVIRFFYSSLAVLVSNLSVVWHLYMWNKYVRPKRILKTILNFYFSKKRKTQTSLSPKIVI